MKLILELKIDQKINWKPDVSKERQLRYLQREFVDCFNDYIIDEQLDDSEYARDDPNHPFFGFSRFNLINFEE